MIRVVVCGGASIGRDCLCSRLASCDGVQLVAAGDALDRLASQVGSDGVDVVLTLYPAAGSVAPQPAERIQACWPAATIVEGCLDGTPASTGGDMAEGRPSLALAGPVDELVSQLAGLHAAPGEAPGPCRAAGRQDPLSPREAMVLKHLALGKTSRESATLLGLSPRTVDGHRRCVSVKLKRVGVARLTRYAIASGLVDAVA